MKICSFDGCGKKAICKGLCAGHYWQQRRGEELRPLQVQYHGFSEATRFLMRVEKGEPDECWPWTGSRQKRRRDELWHGQWTPSGGTAPELAHRASWRLFVGPIPDGMFVLHRCDNPACVNPSHLFLGTQSDNLKDMWAKGRANPKTGIGEKHGNAKLTAEAVLDIRSSKMRGVDLAAKYGIARTTVSDIRKRRIWTHI